MSSAKRHTDLESITLRKRERAEVTIIAACKWWDTWMISIHFNHVKWQRTHRATRWSCTSAESLQSQSWPRHTPCFVPGRCAGLERHPWHESTRRNNCTISGQFKGYGQHIISLLPALKAMNLNVLGSASPVNQRSGSNFSAFGHRLEVRLRWNEMTWHDMIKLTWCAALHVYKRFEAAHGVRHICHSGAFRDLCAIWQHIILDGFFAILNDNIINGWGFEKVYIKQAATCWWRYLGDRWVETQRFLDDRMQVWQILVHVVVGWV